MAQVVDLDTGEILYESSYKGCCNVAQHMLDGGKVKRVGVQADNGYMNENFTNRNKNMNYGNAPYRPKNYGNRGGYGNKQYGGAPKQRFKKSGASFTTIRTGKSQGMVAVNAWIKTRNGLLKISAFGYAKTAKSDRGNEFQKAVAEVTNLGSGQTAKYPVLINITKSKMSIKELNLLVTANGGGRTRSGKNVRGAVVSLVKR